jgi:23S rRNA (uracil1939-C5)-methyltransferase
MRWYNVEQKMRNKSISQVEFFSQDLTKDFSHHSWAKQGFDALLIDPPRQVHMRLCNMYLILEQKESFMFHVIHQHWQGMRVYWHNMVINLKKQVMDMFTHTGHVESIALFEKMKEIND